jgi:hypothetical protein
MVTSLRLTEAFAIFQKYINSVLRKHLNDFFCLAYLNDVLIYSNKSYENHMEKMNSVLQKLGKAGLSLNLKNVSS